MELATFLSLVSTLAIVCSVVFAGLQIRNVQNQRSREAQLLLTRSFQTPEFMKALALVQDSLPEGLSKSEIDERIGSQNELLLLWFGTMESMGMLVYYRVVSLDLIEQFFSAPIIISWRKLERYVKEWRKELQRDTIEEWYQWLAERMQERESKVPRIPAHIAHRGWHE